MTITFGDVAENGPGNFVFHDWVTGVGLGGAWEVAARPLPCGRRAYPTPGRR